MTDFFRFALLGLGSGAVYTLLALGLVLVYRGSGIVNFAQGAFGMAAAFLYYSTFRAEWGLSEAPAMVLAVVITAVLGAVIYVLIARKLRQSGALTRTIATLGVMLMLLAIFYIAYPPVLFRVAIGPLPTTPVSIGDINIPADRFWMLGIAVVATGILWFLSLHPRRARHELPDVTLTRVAPRTLDISDLTVRFGGVVALDGVDLQVMPGQVVGAVARIARRTGGTGQYFEE